MLFESPFYVDFPVAIGIAFGVFGLLAWWLLIVYNRRGSFHDFVVAYFHQRSPGVPLEKWSGVARYLFVILGVIFSAFSLFCFAVATGLVKNKDNSISPEQLERLRQIYEKRRPHGAEGPDD
jgi:hypothetical protein